VRREDFGLDEGIRLKPSQLAAGSVFAPTGYFYHACFCGILTVLTAILTIGCRRALTYFMSTLIVSFVGHFEITCTFELNALNNHLLTFR
jgi:hypothetical protein